MKCVANLLFVVVVLFAATIGYAAPPDIPHGNSQAISAKVQASLMRATPDDYEPGEVLGYFECECGERFSL